MRGLDVGDDQQQALRRAGRGRGQVGAELNRAPGTGRRELDQPKVLARTVGVEPPTQGTVERLRPVDVRDGNNDYLEPGRR
jgi:hypothetical protein